MITGYLKSVKQSPNERRAVATTAGAQTMTLTSKQVEHKEVRRGK